MERSGRGRHHPVPRHVPISVGGRRRPDPVRAAHRPVHRLARRRDLRLLRWCAERGATAIGQAPVTLVDESNAGDGDVPGPVTPRAPHNLFGRPTRLWAFGGGPVPPPPCSRTLAGEGHRGRDRRRPSVSIGYSRDYAVELHVGRGVGHVVARRRRAGRSSSRSGGQIATQNVVILPVVYRGGVGQEGAEAQLVGRGSAIVLRDGTVHARNLGATRRGRAHDVAHRGRGAASTSLPGTPGSSCPMCPTPSTW